MNDRFKFRFWSKSTRKYIDDFVEFYFTAEGEVRILEYAEWGEEMYLEPARVVVEQCTGLYDKDGKLIFEGDILEFQDGDTADVKWIDDQACFILDGAFFTFVCCKDLVKHAKIISNIHFATTEND